VAERGPAREGGRERGGGRERAVAAALVLVPLVLVCLRCAATPAVPFLFERGDAPWIMAPTPVSAQLQQWGETSAPVASFTRSFQSGAPDARVALHLSAFGAVRVYLNGTEVAAARRDHSLGRAETVVDVSGYLRPGANDLRVEVANDRGPALLSLRAEGLPEPLLSDASWSGRLGESVFARAMLADDTRPDPRSLAVETPLDALRERGDSLLLLFVLGGLGFLGARRRLPARLLPGAALGVATLGWAGLFVAKFVRVPPAVGFDARHHLHYMDFILDERALPLAADGWSTYHPPLFHLASAAVASLGGGDAALKVLPFVSGLAVVWASFWLARRLEPDAPGVQALAVLFAATLPVNLYSAAYFSNESLHAGLASLGLLATTSLLLAPRAGVAALAAAGALFGLAALTKFTVLVVVPVAGFFLAWKLLFVERAPPARAARALAAFAGGFLLVAGWFYARNWLHYGAPVVGNWALPGADQVWWQQPGFHTLRYYARFGEVLQHPYLAGFASFWDGVYATFWGDGYLGGRADATVRHTFWSYGFMTVGYWVALPATALLGLGAVSGAVEALGHGEPRRRLARGWLAIAVWALLLAFLSLTLDLPYFGQVKAAYLLMLTAPLAVFFALGVARADAWLDRRGQVWARTLLYAWLAMFAGALFLSFAG